MTDGAGEKRIIDVPGLPDPGHRAYAQCVEAGGHVYLAGQTGIDGNYDPVSLEFAPQARRAFENVELGLAAVDGDLGDLVQLTTYLTDMRYAPAFREIRAEALDGDLAASSLIGVDQLAAPELLIEIEAVAVVTG